MVHGQAEDLVCHFICQREIILSGTGQTAVGGEIAYQRIEISAAEHAVVLHLEIELVAGGSILLGIYEDREVGIVVANARHVVPEGDAGDGAQGLSVSHCHTLAGGNGGVYLAEVEEAVCRAHLVHLAIDAGGNDGDFVGDAEILQIIDAALCLLIMHDEGAALDGVIDLCGMEREGAHIASVHEASDAFFIVWLQTILLGRHFEAEGMGGIVDDAKAVFVGYLLYGFGVARLAVAVDWHDAGGGGGDGGLYLSRVHIAGGGVNINEHGFAAVPPDAVSGGHEAVGGGDDFAGDAQGLEGGHQR